MHCTDCRGACRATKLFHTYDADQSGIIDAHEFLLIMQVLDPGLEMDDVEDTFLAIGATDSLDEDLFFDWCTSLFGDFDDDQFSQQILELIDLSKQLPSEMDPSEARRREG